MHFYYLILLLQGFCFYHAYKNQKEYYWYFVIFFLSGIGCLIYLITQVYNKRDAEVITNEIATIINPSKKVNDLEKALQFSDTFKNRVALADAHLENKDYANAKTHYLKALSDHFKKDKYVSENLIQCYYNLEDYQSCVNEALLLKNDFDFKGSQSQFLYGLALGKLGQLDEAESQLQHIDQRYSNYNQRLVYAKFLANRGKVLDAKDVLTEILNEAKHMSRHNKKQYRSKIDEVKKLYTSL